MAILAGCGASGDASVPENENLGYGGRVLPQPLEKPTIVFTDTSLQPYDFAVETEGQMALLFFGYTSCPDICPVHLGILSAAFDDLRLDGGRPDVAFVGVDTARDTPERLRTYLDGFGPQFIGLTATPSAIDEALGQLNMPSVVIDAEGKGSDYIVGHPSQILVFTPDNLCHITYPFGTRQQAWEEDLPRLENQIWSANQ